jgi:hypothetical protein
VYVRRLRLIWNTELSAKNNKIQANGTLAIPILRYISALLTGIKKNYRDSIEQGKRYPADTDHL